MSAALRTAIFGATSAIAAEVAAVCAARGDRLWLVARDSQKLAALRERLGDAVVGAEVCDFEQLETCAPAVQRAIAGLGGLDRALLAHGYLGDQLRSEADVGYARHVIDVNFTSAVALLLPLAAHFEVQGRGHLAAITSVAGVRGRPRNYTYGASKSALSTYLQGVRSRLYRRGVKVHDIRLGPVPTPMSEGHPQNFLWGEKGQVARGIVKAMERRWHVVYQPGRWALVMAIVRVMPEWLFQRFGFLAGR
ncbi:MAG: SDR family NAD(P)-dependent oxidoreductase [Planctomycetes bacterium]|nr:SDR family NAD(P)-dependent oxidoreductase [Planctomycetota bacterium]